ncbi:MAG: class II fructose-bisphosphate aldolase [Chthonomonadales bacterium]|nr:class II fructose-bisphosphate aldolase [Chthonomonadales bacterium]
MPLVPLPHLLAEALAAGYAVGYFEAWNDRSLEAVLDAAEAEHAPVVLGFGGMMVDGRWLEERGIAMLGALGRALAERARVPTSLLFNEARTLEQALTAVDAGFNCVLLTTDTMPADAALAATHTLVERAHAAGAAVEAELGRLPDAAADGRETGGEATDPGAAAAFVERTRVDCLAVSIGNVHVKTNGWATIDSARLEAIHREVRVPLAVHGGTSFPPRAVPHAVLHGVAKVNVGTALKADYLAALRETASGLPPTPDVHALMGSHRAGDLCAAAQAALTARARALIRLYGGSGRTAGSPEVSR